MVVAGIQKGKRECACAIQAPACTWFVNILFAEQSHVAKPGIKVGRNQNRDPDTGKPTWKSHERNQPTTVPKLKVETEQEATF